MSSAFVPADILKQMFGCLFSVEIKLSWRGGDCRLPTQPVWGTVPAGDASDPGAVLSFPARGMMPAEELRKRCLRPRGWREHPDSSLLLPRRKRKGVGISKTRHNFCCWIFGGVSRLSQEGNRWKGNSLSCLLELSMPRWDMWFISLLCRRRAEQLLAVLNSS